MRKIDYDLPRIIYEQSGERYFDVETGHLIALMKIKLYNKKREVMVAYLKEGENIKLLTIHPLKEGQKKTELTQVDGGDVMKDFKVFYDEKEDILYLAREGNEEEIVEISPFVNIELDSSGMLIGVEVFNASVLFKDVIKSMEKKLQTV